jgi:Ser/Thr protein kinase RdoA (MazF antagonist)
MSSQADHDLARRDGAIPGLATLLDPNAMGKLWSDATGDAIPSAELLYLRYKPGTNCLAAYRIGENEDSRWVYVKAYGSEAAVKLEKIRKGLNPQEVDPSRRILSESPGIVSFEFPDDAKLPTIARLERPARRQRLVARVLGEEEKDVQDELITLAYKPERRYVAKLIRPGVGTSAVLKLYGSERYQAARIAYKELRSSDRLLLQTRCGGSKRYHILAFTWLPGPNLRDEIDSGTLTDLDGVGSAIAEFHRQDAPNLPQNSMEVIASELKILAQTLAFLHPPVAELSAQLARQIPKRMASEGLNVGTIHGDLYDKQIIMSGDQVGLVDLDDAAQGDVRRDLGLFVAHLERDFIMHRDFRAIEEIGETLLEGYQRTLGKRVTNLEPFVAEGMLRLAHHPFRIHVPDWADRTTMILERAREILERGRPQ